MSSSGTWKRRAMPVAPSTNQSPPLIRHSRPTINNRTGISIISLLFNNSGRGTKKDLYHIQPKTGECDKSLKHPVLHRAFLPGVSLQHSAPVFQLKYAPYSLLSREYYTCFPTKAQGEIWDLFCLGHFFGVRVNMLHAGVVEMLVKEHFQLAVGAHRRWCGHRTAPVPARW